MENNSVREEKEMEIDLVSLFFYLIGKWKILLLGGIIGGILAGAIVFFQTPMYESNSTLYVLSKTTSITSMADLQLGTELTSDFTVIATSKPVIDGAIDELKSKKKIKMTREEIQKMLTVANKTDTRFFTSVGHPFPAVCIRTSTERPEALDKACFILSGIDEKGLLQSVDTAVEMNKAGDYGIPVPDYLEENVSSKVVKIIQSYTGVVNKMVWRKEI